MNRMRQIKTHFIRVAGRSFGGMSATWLVTITADEAHAHSKD